MVVVGGALDGLRALNSDDGNIGLSLIGLGMLLVLVGVALASAFLGRPVIRLFGLVYRRAFGTVGTLADRELPAQPAAHGGDGERAHDRAGADGDDGDLRRPPRRRARTAAIDKTLSSQFIVSNVVQQPFSPTVAKQIRGLDGVESVASLRTAFPEVDGGGTFVAAVDPTDVRRRPAVPDGRRARSERSRRRDGGRRSAATAEGKELAARRHREDGVPGRHRRRSRSSPSTAAPTRSARSTSSPRTPSSRAGWPRWTRCVYVTKEPGADTDTVRAEIEEVIEDLPTVTVKDPEGYAAEQKEQINQFLQLHLRPARARRWSSRCSASSTP